MNRKITKSTCPW